MLKIKDDVGIEILRAYGFTPRFDEYTGEVKSFVKVTTDVVNFGTEIKHEKIDKRIRIFKGPRKEWVISKYMDYIDMDTVYDLIQAGLVEKVEE